MAAGPALYESGTTHPLSRASSDEVEYGADRTVHDGRDPDPLPRPSRADSAVYSAVKVPERKGKVFTTILECAKARIGRRFGLPQSKLFGGIHLHV